MSRKPRNISSTGLYHIVNRGIGKQIIFETEIDYAVFLKIMASFLEKMDISMLAYCLMDNHFHFIIYDKEQNISKFMQKVQYKYARYYNARNMRNGYVFQGRFYSETIESEEYLLKAIAYVHMNPQKAGICKYKEYKYSSSVEYTGGDGFTIIDFEALNSYIKDKNDIVSLCDNYLDDDYLNEFEYKHLTEKDTDGIVKRVLKLKNGREIQNMQKKERDFCLKKLKSCGLSVRQIERQTGIGRGVITRVLSKTRE